ncbi:lactate racemase domain-containing protein [bacterium]|nr:lactate racemase domain-containing protein [bacterium]
MDIPLRYGSGHVTLHAPERNVAGVVRPTAGPGGEGVHPASRDEFRPRARGRRALLLVPDATRRPDAAELDTAVSALADAASLRVAVATGSHSADTPANREIVDTVRDAARRHGAPEPDMVLHDCRLGPFTDHGTTPRGNPVRLSTCLDDRDLALVVADVKHHYFAGYSNPLKFFLPGVADFATIEANHRLALDPGSVAGHHPFHPDPARRDNPLAAEMLAAYRAAWGPRDAYALVTVRAGERIAHRGLGPLEEVTPRAFAAADAAAGVRVDASAYIVISAGGAPMDATLYLCQRALELSRAAIADGAEVLLLAECADGSADSDTARVNFYDELTRPLDEIVARIRDGYRLYQHKAYRFAELLQRIAALHLASLLPEDQVRAAHFRAAPSPQAVLDGWIARDPACRITFLDEGNRLVVLGSAS